MKWMKDMRERKVKHNYNSGLSSRKYGVAINANGKAACKADLAGGSGFHCEHVERVNHPGETSRQPRVEFGLQICVWGSSA